ncbi:MAG: ComEA family DNA-binding protein [Oscillospiraceae bacterium]
MTRQTQRRLAHVLLIASGALILLTGAVILHAPSGAETDAEPAEFGTLPRDALLDLNDASAEELVCLPGIGPVKAEAIIARREELGGFQTREDILSVPGIGEATLEKISPYITYGTRSTP